MGKRSAIMGVLTEVLPADPTGTDVMRLMIANHVLDTLHHHMDLSVAPEVKAIERHSFVEDSFFTLFLLATGSLKEGLNAYKTLGHWLTDIERRAKSVDRKNDENVLVPRPSRVMLDKIVQNKESEEMKVIDRFRNDAAFHFQRKPISEVLRGIDPTESAIVEVWEMKDAMPMRFTAPMALHAAAAFGTPDQAQWKRDIEIVRSVMSLFYDLTSHYIAEFLFQAGCRLVEIRDD